MPQSLGKVLGLLELLQAAPGGVTVGHLADRLQVDERTVRRYAGQLAGLGIPIEGRRGRHGGYTLAPGYRLPPLMLTDEEALAVLLGLLAARRAGLTVTAEATETATAKIQRVLPHALRARTDALLATLDFTATRAVNPSTPDTGILLTLAAAARDHRPVTFTYTKPGKPGAAPGVGPDEPGEPGGGPGQPGEPGVGPGQPGTEPGRRRVDPYGLVFHAGKWFLTGHDHDRGAVRTFRLDRVAAPVPLAGTFAVPAGFDPAARVAEGLATGAWRHEVSVLLDLDLDEARRRIPPTAATLHRTTHGTRMTARAERLDGMARMLAGLGCPVTVETPDALRAELHRIAARLRDA
ncbi:MULTISPECIES: YafY family protein [unclassified Actinoplanes]|uniref:helix-turn-helix transcriptional regulator n=1 Tax=unclassified Actinoplanes TaxID=2626549 RepID=UPI0002E179FE|nr:MULTISPECIES: WYL domain-containing protein [unclassified Actinoplanes]SLM01482.1 MerR-family transcriptional regulator [Actinoplanes sp. SE50/110]